MTKRLSSLKALEVELNYRTKVPCQDRPKIVSANDAFILLRHYWDDNKIDLIEEFKILLLDRGNTVLGISNVGSGGIAGCIADPKIVFALALKARATGIILAHNHPSGSLKPSRYDINITKKFVECGKMLEVDILDHLILTSGGFYSFGNEGMIPI
ncbi:JAB domain-containing protein [Hufsiella ginkgonis]|uniref:DNA repair protein n=1 Tax=Hufsiella ginkgonis TaxID=2695274 RepID=A0A7K1Y0U3_9SPHI|nr:JAB domain-containing protein [Hufsiella ginkgonis]MXV16894.1 DNA repair protein [Hufsiella ginkgonis]